MGCRGCGKKGLDAIARASAEITLPLEGLTMPARPKRPTKQQKEKRPRHLETKCASCGKAMKQDWEKVLAENLRRKRYCSKACARKSAQAQEHRGRHAPPRRTQASTAHNPKGE